VLVGINLFVEKCPKFDKYVSWKEITKLPETDISKQFFPKLVVENCK